MSENEKQTVVYPIDPEQGDEETPETRRSNGWLVLAGILSVLAFLLYTKTPCKSYTLCHGQ
jgi:hypothetical protein